MNCDIILHGNCIETLKTIPNESIDCCITSPPYYGLRDYGMGEQIGLEETPEEYINKLVAVFREVKRVLKDEGTLWVNIGDSYNGNKWDGAKPKDLIGIPWLLAFALRNDGWYLRQDIIWHKPNPMPESVKDRCTKSHEYIFLLSKQPKYYFDYEAIQEPANYKDAAGIKFGGTKYGENDSSNFATYSGNEYTSNGTRNKRDVWNVSETDYSNSKFANAEQESSIRQGMNKERGEKIIALRKRLPDQFRFVKFMRSRTTVDMIDNNSSIKRSTIEHWFRTDESGFCFPSVENWNEIKWLVDDYSEEFAEIDERLTDVTYETDAIDKNANGMKNKRDVWSVIPSHYKEAHFATFPEELVTPMLLAGCPKNGVVLDPFMGSGTTGAVAILNKRHYIGCELNEAYIEMANRRIADATKIANQVTFDDLFADNQTTIDDILTAST